MVPARRDCQADPGKEGLELCLSVLCTCSCETASLDSSRERTMHDLGSFDLCHRCDPWSFHRHGPAGKFSKAPSRFDVLVCAGGSGYSGTVSQLRGAACD